MPRQKNSSRGVADVTNAVRVLNDRTPGAGDQLSQVIRHLSGRIDAQAGHNGTVAIAKQPTTITGGTAAGLNLNSTRLTGMPDPVQGKDLVTLDFFRRHETCDAFRQRVEDCLKLEIPTLQISGPGPGLFRPAGNILFADVSLPYVYFLHGVINHIYDEQKGAIGVIDISDPHNPERIAFQVITNYAGPIWFMVDYTRRIGFVRDLIRSGPGAHDEYLWASYDFSDPHNPTVISYAGSYPTVPEQWFESPGRPGWFRGQLGNKVEGENTLFGYYMNDTVIHGQIEPHVSFETTWYRLHVWNFTDPGNMIHTHTYEMGGYYVDSHGFYPPPSDFGINGAHLQWATDRLGRGSFATSVSAGDQRFNFTPRSELFLNNWDISDPANIQLRGRLSLGMGVVLSGSYLTNQVRLVLMWGSRVYALVTTYDPDSYPDDPTGVTLFGIDCSGNTPVVKTKTRSACGAFTNMDIFENCLFLRVGAYDTVWDVSDLSNFQLIGGCVNFFPSGYANYRPGYLYEISLFGQPSPDPNLPDFGFGIDYFGESGIVCP